MDALKIYKPEENQYFGPGKTCQTIVLDSKDFGRGCIMLVQKNTFGYGFTKSGRGTYKIKRTLYIEVWEYESTQSDALPVCLYYQDLKTLSKRTGKAALKHACWNGIDLSGDPAPEVFSLEWFAAKGMR